MARKSQTIVTRELIAKVKETRKRKPKPRIYEGQGYTVERTGASHDGGIDLLAERCVAGARERIVVQCEHQRGNMGRPVVQQLWGIINCDWICTRGDLVTSAGFTSEAMTCVEGKRVTLVDRARLKQLAGQFGVADFWKVQRESTAS